MNTLQVKERTLFQKVDFNLVLVVLTIHIIGLINVYSATHGPSAQGVSSLFFAQALYIFAGWLIFAACTFFDYRLFLKLAYPIYIINCLLLVTVALIGKTSMGGTRWLDLGPFHYQPSETMKLALVLTLAKYFHTHVKPDGHNLKELLAPLALVAIPAILVIRQPDLGTGIMLIAIAGTMFIFVKIKTRVLISAVLAAMFVFPVAWKYVFKEYQKKRIHMFLDPSSDPQGAGYNSIQSKIAIGSGKVFGKGFRKGTQSQLEFLPESHTDFIFSVLSEEHGFVGSMTTLCLFMILILIGIRTASQANDKFGALIAVGVIATLFWHMFVNIGMTTGILPIVGIPLPMVSYGGSSLLTNMMGLGIISSVSLRRFLF